MSQNKNIFNQVATAAPQRSNFDLSETHVTACNFGELIPVYVKTCLPGSTWKMSTEWLVKIAPTLAPIMSKNIVYAHSWYVPHRVVWENWVNFITETKVEDVLPAIPYLGFNPTVTDPGEVGEITRLANYLGMPFGSVIVDPEDENFKVQAFWFAAYQKVWSDCYRDQNLQEEIPWELVDGSNQSNFTHLTRLRMRNWMHDYFTSALPDTQKGDPVNIPMTFTDTPIYANQNQNVGSGNIENTIGVNPDYIVPAGTPDGTIPDTQGIFADTSALAAQALLIDLRTAEQLQKFRETMMTHGSRYNEFLEAMYGVKISDDTVQRPVYLGGVRADLIVSELLATTANETADQPQGNMTGNGRSYAMGDLPSYTCPEHGTIMTILSIMPQSMYFQGIPKELLKIEDPFEFGNPLMANIGEQPIQNQEIYAYGVPSQAVATFGYQMRYAEYKQASDRISSDMTGSLLFWTQARQFDNAPALNGDFVSLNAENEGLDRIFNVVDPDTLKLWITIRTTAHVVAPLPYFGTPKLGG